MKCYHCTTPKKLDKYQQTGCILPPVRWWTNEYSAEKWNKKTGRTIILTFDEPPISYRLPVGGGAKWSPNPIFKWEKK